MTVEEILNGKNRIDQFYITYLKDRDGWIIAMRIRDNTVQILKPDGFVRTFKTVDAALKIVKKIRGDVSSLFVS